MIQYASVLYQRVAAVLLGISLSLPSSCCSGRDCVNSPLIAQPGKGMIREFNVAQQSKSETSELATTLRNDERGNQVTAQSFQAQNAKIRNSGPSWKVKYASGSLGLKPDQWLKVAFVADTAFGQQEDTTIRVPAEQLSLVEYDATTEKNSALLQGPRSGCSYAHSMMPDMSKRRPENVIVTIASRSRISRLAEWLCTRHPVHFIWNAGNKQESMNLDVDDCEYESFIANTRWLLGARWQNLARSFKR
jgi:hypothetical protein